MDKEKFVISGMHCKSCEKIIESEAYEEEGVVSCKADYVSGKCEIVFDPKKTNLERILERLKQKGHSYLDEKDRIKRKNKNYGIATAIVVVLFGAYFIIKNTSGFSLPSLGTETSLVIIFLIGLLTGFHCIAMCGGFIVSYSTKNAKKKGIIRQHLSYGVGKIISYAAFGALFGLMGSLIVFTPKFRGIIAVLAGVFLLAFGLKMLDVIPILRKIQFRTPKFIRKISKDNSTPLVTGLLNGFMIACGPLLAIYIYAAGTGSIIKGAVALAVFALGTLPVMIGFGILTSVISAQLTNKILKASGVLVMILGIIMINRGLALTGSGYDFNTMITGSVIKENNNLITMNQGYQEIRMDVTSSGWEPDRFVLKKDIPVKWIINGKEINGCNNAIQVPKLGLNFDIKQGEQIIEFTPTQEGVIPWSCWMGMIPGVFIVKDDVSNVNEIKEELDSVEQSRGGCGGGCGCGSR